MLSEYVHVHDDKDEGHKVREHKVVLLAFFLLFLPFSPFFPVF